MSERLEYGEIGQTPACEDGLRVPSHGRGQLGPAFTGGLSGNPGGKPKSLKDVRSLARKQSMNALHALIGVYTLPNGKLDRSADGRMVVAAAQTVLLWAYGKPPDYDPATEQPETKIDLSGLNLAQRKALLETLARVTTVSGVAEDDGPDFEPERFAPEPVTIEAEPVRAPVVTMPETRGQRPVEEDPAVFAGKRATLQANAQKNMAKRRKRAAKPKPVV